MDGSKLPDSAIADDGSLCPGSHTNGSGSADDTGSFSYTLCSNYTHYPGTGETAAATCVF